VNSVVSPAPAHRARPFTDIRAVNGLFNLELSAVWRYRELFGYLILRELKVRYKQAALGVGWALLQPIFAVMIFSLIFGHFAKFPSDGIPYSVFAFAAVLPWTYFAESFRRSSVSLVGDSELIRKVYFPRLVIPLAMAATPVVDFVLGFFVLLALMAWHGLWPTWNILLVAPCLLVTLGLALSISLWLAPLCVRYRDVVHTLPFVIQIWMYATPIVYPLSIVPQEWRTLYMLNPMVGIIEAFRWAILGRGHADVTAIGISAAIIAVVLVGGLIYFRRCERMFADVI